MKEPVTIPHTDESGARRDLVPEGVSDLSGTKGQFSLVELQQAFEVEEHPLSCFRPQIPANVLHNFNTATNLS